MNLAATENRNQLYATQCDVNVMTFNGAWLK